MQKASYLRPKKRWGGVEKKKTLSLLLSMPGFLLPAAPPPRCPPLPLPEEPRSRVVCAASVWLQILAVSAPGFKIPHRGSRREPGAGHLHTSGSGLVPCLYQTPGLKMVGGGRIRDGDGQFREEPEVCRAQRTKCHTMWDGKMGAAQVPLPRF